MAYNTGVFTLFNQSKNYTNVFADTKSPTFAPPASFSYGSVYGKSIAPTVSTSGTGTVINAYGQLISLSISSAGSTVSNAYAINLAGPVLNAGTLTNVYTLFVAPPVATGGTITNSYTAYFGLPTAGVNLGGIGIGTTTPKNALDVKGGAGVGVYASSAAIAANSLAISGSVGVATSSPAYSLDVNGSLNAGAAYGWVPQADNQLITLAEGNNQGGFGGGSVGTIKTMSGNTTLAFDTGAFVNSNSRGFEGAVFDGRYIYYVPNAVSGATLSGQITRFDTTQQFGVSSSYAVFDTRTINSNSAAFQGAIFDGRYIYFVPNRSSTPGQVTRFDTTLPFGISTSYAVFDTATVQSNSRGFAGAVFDGRYVYYVPSFNGTTVSGQITQYDTTLPFAASASYSVFDTGIVNSASKGFFGGAYDGRYVYFVPFSNATYSGQITQYDTTLPFGTGASYQVFNTAAVSPASAGFQGAVFDGRFIYFVPYLNTNSYVGQVTRYDTTGSFLSAASYTIFNMTAINSNCVGFQGAVFDGRFVYYVPSIQNATLSGQVTRFDTTQSFQSASSYTVFDTATVNSLSRGFAGGVFDGRYLYLVPHLNSSTYSGQISRLDAYPGTNPNVMIAGQLSSSFAIGLYAGVNTPPLNGLIVSGGVGIGTSNPQYFLDVNGAINAQFAYGLMPQQPNQSISLAEGYDQGGFGGGSVGTQKTMNSNATLSFNLTAINSLSASFVGAAFDGRYLYFVPSVSGSPITRYDTSSLAFASTASYAASNVYYTASVNNVLSGGSIYDGRYIYFIPGVNGQFTRYDTTLPFLLATSYSIANLASLVNASSQIFSGAVFDGRYVYLVPTAGTSIGQITRFDTTGSFLVSSSYAAFDTTTVQSNSKNFQGGTYDGRYVYFVPFSSGQPGQITRFDTTLSFTAASSYAVFDTQTVNTASQGFWGAVFDGRFIYFVPNSNGQITRFDTTGSFISASSYATFDTAFYVSTASTGFRGGCFDGRYVYLFNGSQNRGSFTRLDTTQSFLNSTSYSIFASGTTTLLQGGVFDGRNIYAAPSNSGLAIRLDAYPGPNVNAIAASNFPSAFAIGNYASVISPLTNNLIVSGGAGFGTSSPAYFVDVGSGAVSAQYIYGFMPQQPNQKISLAEGYNQGGFGGGSVGTFKTMSQNTTIYFDTTTVTTLSLGFRGGIFDGRYVYLVPDSNGWITRYDTTVPFSTSTSYASFNLSGQVNSGSYGFAGGVFDGRYIYFVPNTKLILTRYDTTLPFLIASSYSIFTLSNPYLSGTFDGRYIYFSGGPNTAVRYDTTQSFLASSSYTTSPTLAGSAFAGSAFDGRYIYFAPNSGGIVENYDTTLPFSTASSFNSFNLSTNISTSSVGFWGAVFDGRFLYYIPSSGSNGVITRYDTYGTFSSSSSYAIFDTAANVNSNSGGFNGGVFDGRYVYFIPNASGQVTRYDTTQSFLNSTSYTFFNTITGNGNSTGFIGGVFDGRYIYLVPNKNSTSGQITRLDAYPGSAASALATNNVNPTGFSIGAYAGITTLTNSLLVSGSVGIGTSAPNYLVDVAGSVNAGYIYGQIPQEQNELIVISEGLNQSGFSSGSVGTNKTLSANTTVSFNTTAFVNAASTGFNGAVFDGRFIYFVPNNLGTSGQITRFDTQATFGVSSSYAIYNLTNVNSSCVGFNGALFDGRYVYFIPNNNTFFTRYDTTQPFLSAYSYSVFSFGSTFSGGLFDGRYAYLTSSVSTVLSRYDTTLPFNLSKSYTTFDTTSVVAGGNYLGGAYDGRYVYFAPFDSGTAGKLLRYDTTASFSSSNSYAFFDMAANLNSLCVGYWGSTFDGRYVYLSPYFNNTTSTGSGQAVRYDTTASFTTSTSYTALNFISLTANTLAAKFNGAVFDGRYVYYMPTQGAVLRYDTTLSFTSGSSFSTQTITGTNSGYGGLFDGRHIYISPHLDGVINRIDGYPGPQATAIAAAQAPNGFAVGTYAGVNSPAPNNLIVGGALGVNTPTPAYPLDVAGAVNAQIVYGYMPKANNQLVNLFEGNSQSGYGGGVVGTNKTLNTNSTSYFDMSTVNSNCKGFSGGIFDGRYIYFVPFLIGSTSNAQITRFDTTLTFGTSTSYALFNPSTQVNSMCAGFWGGVFDGRYVYFVPYQNNSTYIGQILRYDTTLSFSSSSSYAIFNTTQVNSNSIGFVGGVFDGRYIYLVPNTTNLASSGQITRFDTTLSFTSASSYAVFNTASVSVFSTGFYGGAFDGQYVYLVPNSITYITRYDTTLSFTAGASYAVFNTTTVTGVTNAYAGASFDGRYMYFIPTVLGAKPGQILRYDTTLTFNTTSSYATFDTQALNASSEEFFGSIFDGRYLYLVPGASGQVTRYDTTLPFSLSTSYSVFNTASGNASSTEFLSGAFDGRYLYLVPDGFSIITRLDAYPGPAASGLIAATQAANGFTLGSSLTNAVTAASATVGTNTVPTQPVGYLIITINGTPQKIAYYS